MKSRLLVCLAFASLLCSAAVAQTYVYVGSVKANPGQPIGAVALKSTGDLYYVTFSTSSQFIHVQGAIQGLADDSYTTSLLSTETLPSGRGLNDVEVDAAGNVYICGTGTAGTDTVLKKFGPAPTHTLLWDMQTLANAADKIRINGIEAIDATTLACSEAWNKVTFKNAADGVNTGTSVSGGTSYQRSLAFNSTNNDIYAGKNGDYLQSALKVFSGGTPSTLGSYALALDNQLAPLGNGSQYGSATQAVDYDPDNDKLLIADNKDQQATTPDTNQGLRIYSIAGSGASTVFTEQQAILGRGTLTYNNCYGISYAQVNAKSYIALAVQTDPTPGAPTSGDEAWTIDIYGIPPAGVQDWRLYN